MIKTSFFAKKTIFGGISMQLISVLSCPNSGWCRGLKTSFLMPS